MAIYPELPAYTEDEIDEIEAVWAAIQEMRNGNL